MAQKKARTVKKHYVIGAHIIFGLVFFALALTAGFFTSDYFARTYNSITAQAPEALPLPPLPPLDKELYDTLMHILANNPVVAVASSSPALSSTTNLGTSASPSSTKSAPPAVPVVAPLWPVKAVYPNAGALLPFNRIIAYYGNLYSKQMGVLGQYPENEMLAKLLTEVKNWQEADPSIPAIPALHYIVVTAQGSAGDDGMYRLRMPDSEIDKVLEMAKKINAIVFLDFQVALSDLQSELPLYENYFKMPNVHLGIDPEFSMKGRGKPGKVIGTFDAVDINYAANYLATLVQENHLPPKVLVVHRFTGPMVTNYKNITPLPEVQIVIDMDGWGPPAQKMQTYFSFIYSQPVQFTGFKLFYRNDTQGTGRLMTPAEVLKLRPIPSYIQYQ